MKTLLAVVFLLGLSCTFAMKKPISQVAIKGLHLDKMSPFGSAIKGLIQLAEVQEFDEILEILQQSSQDFQGLLDRERARLGAERGLYEDTRASLEETIAYVEEAITAFTDSLNSALESKRQTEENIAADIASIESNQESISTEITRRADAEAAFQSLSGHYLSALQAVSDAEAIIEQVASADLDRVGLSFLQVQRKKLAKHLSFIAEKLTVAKGKTSSVNFYVKQLLAITQEVEGSGTVNAAFFIQLRAMLQQFGNNLSSELAALREANDADISDSASLIASLEEVIALAQADLELNREYLEQYIETIESLTEVIASFTAYLADLQDALATLIANWEAREAYLNGVIERLEGDYGLLQAAINFFEFFNTDEELERIYFDDEGAYYDDGSSQYVASDAQTDGAGATTDNGVEASA